MLKLRQAVVAFLFVVSGFTAATAFASTAMVDPAATARQPAAVAAAGSVDDTPWG